ncbi:hypothetical protein ACVINI_005930 [Rhizobium beringeri]
MGIFETADYGVAAFAADGFRACASKHAVEDGAADGDFGLLTRQRLARRRRPMMDLYRPIVVTTSQPASVCRSR